MAHHTSDIYSSQAQLDQVERINTTTTTTRPRKKVSSSSTDETTASNNDVMNNRNTTSQQFNIHVSERLAVLETKMDEIKDTTEKFCEKQDRLSDSVIVFGETIKSIEKSLQEIHKKQEESVVFPKWVSKNTKLIVAVGLIILGLATGSGSVIEIIGKLF